MSQIWDIYCKHCLWSIFGPCWCTKSCKTTFYAHLLRIWKLARFTRFIRKIFVTKILLSGKFSFFLTLIKSDQIRHTFRLLLNQVRHTQPRSNYCSRCGGRARGQVLLCLSETDIYDYLFLIQVDSCPQCCWKPSQPEFPGQSISESESDQLGYLTFSTVIFYSYICYGIIQRNIPQQAIS